MRYFAIVGLAALWLFSGEAEASCTAQTVDRQDAHVVYEGSCTEDNENLIITGSVDEYDYCWLHSTTGAVDVFVSLNGSDYSTDPLSLTSFGATDTNPVLLTSAGRIFVFAARFARIIVRENGATDAAAILRCVKS